MTSIYRGNACPDCDGEGRIRACGACGGAGTLLCDICSGNGVRMVPTEAGMRPARCLCASGYFTCAACSGGTGVCGRCSGTGMVQGK